MEFSDDCSGPHHRPPRELFAARLGGDDARRAFGGLPGRSRGKEPVGAAQGRRAAGGAALLSPPAARTVRLLFSVRETAVAMAAAAAAKGEGVQASVRVLALFVVVALRES